MLQKRLKLLLLLKLKSQRKRSLKLMPVRKTILVNTFVLMSVENRHANVTLDTNWQIMENIVKVNIKLFIIQKQLLLLLKA